MKLLIQSAMIFFGTLMAAAVVALGEPAEAGMSVAPVPMARHPGLRGQVSNSHPWSDLASVKTGYGLR
ncbi:MAG: hypothetical protein M3150_05385 [Pseudomonadota bacterium]|nr:hypothetical protein [Pseudomonadota bacterium]